LSSTIDYFQANSVDVLLYLNSDLDSTKTYVERNIVVLGTGCNSGIAKAHSSLLDYATQKGYEYLIISDQDTVYPEKYISSMLEFVDIYEGVSVICPAWINLNSTDKHPEKQYVLEDTKMKLRVPNYGERLAHGISSGMFIVLKQLAGTQCIDDELFIDWVDNDFCWTLNSLGHQIQYNNKINLSHSLGDNVKKIGRIKITTRPPIRDYYIVRNSFFLILYRNYNLQVKGYLILKFFSHITLSLLSSETFESFKNRFVLLSKAIYHSSRKRLGPL
jgi:rhamnosyltransferase